MSGHRDARARSHPLDIGGHWRAVDLGRVGNVCREWWNLGDGKQQELVFGEEVLHTAINLRSQTRGATNVRSRDDASLLDVPDDRVLQLIAVIVEKVTVTQFKVPGA